MECARAIFMCKVCKHSKKHVLTALSRICMILVFLYTAMQANTYIYVFLSIVTIRPKKHTFICLLLFNGENYDV